MYQLLIFDWDGTVMDSAQKIVNCIQGSARSLGLPEPTFDDAKRVIGLGLSEAMHVLFPRSSQNSIKRLVDGYRLHWLEKDVTDQRLFPGVREGLKELAESGAFLAVATGKSRQGLQRQLTELNLEHYFTVTRCADETRSKPHPQMLEEILDYTAINPHKALMIGDTTYDVQMAAQAKIAALGVAYGVHQDHELIKYGALEVFASFAELLAWLKQDRLQPAFAD